MRVIAGEFRSRRLKTPPGLDCRPTPDRLRESLFSILQPRLEGATFVDAYAGSGSVGIEALSRGAARALFIERNRTHVEVLRENLRCLGIDGRAQVFTGKAADVLRHQDGGILFFDPPYAQTAEYEGVLAILAARPGGGLALVQHSRHQALPASAGAWKRTRELRQGDNWITFYQPEAPA